MREGSRGVEGGGREMEEGFKEGCWEISGRWERRSEPDGGGPLCGSRGVNAFALYSVAPGSHRLDF